jgi:hypothetical protein
MGSASTGDAAVGDDGRRPDVDVSRRTGHDSTARLPTCPAQMDPADGPGADAPRVDGRRKLERFLAFYPLVYKAHLTSGCA